MLLTSELDSASEAITTAKIEWSPGGYKSWTWKGYKINYVDYGKASSVSKQPLLLIHGFGASVFHWRYNLPTLSEKYHVFAIDLLGFGSSDKVATTHIQCHFFSYLYFCSL
jgi:pimeloyl-ACP methyl ester carboxylesterase